MAEAKKRGVEHDARRRSELGARTRVQVEDIHRQGLAAIWRGMLNDAEFQSIKAALTPRVKQDLAHSQGAKVAVDFGIEYRFSRESTSRERQLLTDIIWRGVGQSSVAAIDAEYGRRPMIRDGEHEKAWVTTPDVLNEERAMLRFARNAVATAAASNHFKVIYE